MAQIGSQSSSFSKTVTAIQQLIHESGLRYHTHTTGTTIGKHFALPCINAAIRRELILYLRRRMGRSYASYRRCSYFSSSRWYLTDPNRPSHLNEVCDPTLFSFIFLFLTKHWHRTDKKESIKADFKSDAGNIPNAS